MDDAHRPANQPQVALEAYTRLQYEEAFKPTLQFGCDRAFHSVGVVVSFIGWYPSITICLFFWAICVGWFLADDASEVA